MAHACTSATPAREQRVGAVLNPLGHVGVRRSAVRRVVLEAAVLGRIVRGRDHDAVGEVGRAAAVVGENGPRDDRRRRDAAVALEDGLDTVRGQHFERGALRRLGQRVRVLAHVERTIDAVSAPVVADRLRDRRDVRLGERAVERRAAMPARAKAHELARVARVRLPFVVRLFQPRQIDQDRLRGGFPRQRRDRPAFFPVCVTVFSTTVSPLRHGARLRVPDVGRVLGDGARSLENLPGAGHVQDRLARPRVGIGVERAEAASASR